MGCTFVLTDLEPICGGTGYVQHWYPEPWSGSFVREATPRELERWRTEQLIKRGGPKREERPTP